MPVAVQVLLTKTDSIMSEHAAKIQESKDQSAEAEGLEKGMSGGSRPQFIDNRPEAVAQRKIQQAANQHPRTLQLKSYQESANNRPVQLQKGSGVVQRVKTKEEKPKQNFKIPKKKKAPPKKHTAVEDGGTQVIVNFIWIGDGQLDSLSKYNIYSWRALGHEVNIYVHHFQAGLNHDADSLGLEEGDANVIPLRGQLEADDQVKTDINTADKPEELMGDTRAILSRWLNKSPENLDFPKHHTYNLADLAKSYIGGTKQGIVLDLKVGPSVHLEDYAKKSFKERMIGATRGGNSTNAENYMIGTMQEGDELRSKYAASFNNKVKGVMGEETGLGKLTKALEKDGKAPLAYNHICGYHGKAYNDSKNAKREPWLNVAEQTPTGEKLEKRSGWNGDLPVSEPGIYGHGPFRVHKHPSDQANKPNCIRTNPAEVKEIAGKALEEEMPEFTQEKKHDQNRKFLEKAREEQGKLPEGDDEA